MTQKLNKIIYNFRYRIIYFYHIRIKKYSLEKYLLQSNKNLWLDIGSSINKSNLNFDFCDLYPVEEGIEEFKGRYFQLDITKEIDLKESSFKKYDFIRMQHVFEHFTYEEADIVVKNCSKLLKPNGLLLISVPDLDIMIKLYKKKILKNNRKFYN